MRHILVADDSGVVRDLVANYLEVFDTELTFASSGTEAWQRFQQLTPDLVISDIAMPGLTGVELAQRIRKQGARRIPIILMSSGDGETGRAAVTRGEADVFLQKPVVGDVLVDSVARLLGVVPTDVGVRSSRPRIRVVIADDTEVGRQLLARLLAVDKRFEVVGTAQDGAQAVQLAVRKRPQLVLMDALMPVMDGIAATRRIMRDAPTRVIIVTGESGLRSAGAALDATKAGALDLLAKPTWHQLNTAETLAALERLRELAEVPVVRRWCRTSTPARPRPRPPAGRVGIVAVCASTGGPAVLAQLLPQIRPALPRLTVLIVQHVLSGFSEALALWLTETSGVPVELAVDGAAPERGKVILAPDGHHLAVESRDTLRVTDDPPIGAHRPSGTLLFESVARIFANEVLAIMLTGMGRDGVRGLHTVRARRGTVLVQEPDTCAVPGMPSAAIQENLADLVLTPDQLAEEIVARALPQQGDTA
jgi:two-component system chemotaxis response regulator CheB